MGKERNIERNKGMTYKLRDYQQKVSDAAFYFNEEDIYSILHMLSM